jgi:hypothetical protein
MPSILAVPLPVIEHCGRRDDGIATRYASIFAMAIHSSDETNAK